MITITVIGWICGAYTFTTVAKVLAIIILSAFIVLGIAFIMFIIKEHM